jgi:hypothetical protein
VLTILQLQLHLRVQVQVHSADVNNIIKMSRYKIRGSNSSSSSLRGQTTQLVRDRLRWR